MPKVIKLEQSIYECLLGFYFNNIFCAATKFWLHRQFSSAQFRKRRNDGGDGFSFGATAAGLF